MPPILWIPTSTKNVPLLNGTGPSSKTYSPLPSTSMGAALEDVAVRAEEHVALAVEQVDGEHDVVVALGRAERAL